MKHAVGELKVNPLDQVLYRNCLSALVSMIIIYVSSSTLEVRKDMRRTLFVRSVIGVAGNTAMTFGIVLIPLVYQQTINGTTPFWAALAGYIVIGETIGNFTKAAMLVSFCGVVIIACSPYILNEASDTVEEASTTLSTELANLIGCTLILFNSVAQGLVAVATRMMQKLHWSVILFYYALVALFSISLIYCVTTSDLGRIFAYSGEQFGWIAITASFNMIALIAKTISSQNEKSGLITMFSYIGIAYACIVDFAIFKDYLNWLEWLGTAIILLTTLALTLRMLFKSSKPQAKSIE